MVAHWITFLLQTLSLLCFCLQDFIKIFRLGFGCCEHQWVDVDPCISAPLITQHRREWFNPLACFWLIWSIQNNVKKQKNDWNPGKWVLVCSYWMRAFLWIPTWLELDGFLISYINIVSALKGLTFAYCSRGRLTQIMFQTKDLIFVLFLLFKMNLFRVSRWGEISR